MTVDEAQSIADDIGYPVIIKAVAGGGGRGMTVVRRREDLANDYRSTRATAQAVFKDSNVYIERYLEAPLPHRGAARVRHATATASTSASATAPSSAATRS